MNCTLVGICLLDSLCALVGVCVVGQVCVTWGEAVCPGEGLYAPGSVFMPDESSTLAGVCLCAVGWSLCPGESPCDMRGVCVLGKLSYEFSGACGESLCCGKPVYHRQSSRSVVRVRVPWGVLVYCRVPLHPVE